MRQAAKKIISSGLESSRRCTFLQLFINCERKSRCSMPDDDFLPEKHPLNQYLSELELTEDRFPTSSSEGTPPTYREQWTILTTLKKELQTSLPSCFSGLIFSSVVYPAEYLRCRILRTTSSSGLHLSDDETLIKSFNIFHQNRLEDSRSHFLIFLAFYLLMPLGLIQSYSVIFWITSCLVLALFLTSMSFAIWMVLRKLEPVSCDAAIVLSASQCPIKYGLSSRFRSTLHVRCCGQGFEAV
ncbi:hypothetical protein AHF37_00068 [Paragonimus kellicotti]|nr:hypothetical protein AHF37_00068 [Paragonimus kellicotti]